MKLFLFFVAMTLTTGALAKDPLPALKIVELEQDVYLHVSYQHVTGFGLVSSNGLIVVDGSNAFIIDTPWSTQDTQILAEWIIKQGYQLTASISTHSHADRTAGIAWLNKHSIPTYASAKTNALLAARAEATATHVLEQQANSVIPATVIETFFPGGGHTADNIAVWLPRTHTLFGGCLIRADESNSLGFTGEAVLDEWANSAKNLLDRFPSARRVVPGHGEPGDRNLLKHTIKLANSAYNSPH